VTDERALRDALQQRAARVTTEPDVANLVHRLTRRSVRVQRIAAATIVLAVIVGPAAGFAVARASQREATSGLTVNGQGSFESTPLPKVASSSGKVSYGGVPVGPPTGLQTPMGRLLSRTSRDGIVLRVYAARVDPPVGEAVPWWHPAPWCFVNRVVQVDASNDLIAGITTGSLYAAPRNGLVVSRTFIGTGEQAPAWVAIVQSSKGTSARATFDDGGTDSASLDGGVAVLAHATTAATDRATLGQHVLRVDILDAAGAVVANESVDDAHLDLAGLGKIGGSDPQCTVPTQLPSPGAHQPRDVATATAAVTQAYETMFNGSLPAADHLANIDDPDGAYAAAARRLGASGQYAAQRHDSRAHVVAVVFTDATHAAVEFEITIGVGGTLGHQLGGAIDVDGRWKVAQGTGCVLLANGGFPC
jgi:hypothetical protein